MKVITRYIKTWSELGLYGKFEQVLAILLTVVIAVVIVASFIDLLEDIYIFFLVQNGIDDRAFVAIFGHIMTVLIAMEFNHSILQVLHSQAHLIQVRTVVLIAILAISRKFIVLELNEQSYEMLIALAVVAAALALLYWVLSATSAVGEGGRQRITS